MVIISGWWGIIGDFYFLVCTFSELPKFSIAYAIKTDYFKKQVEEEKKNRHLVSSGDPECSPSKSPNSYLEDVLALSEVTVEVAGCIQLKEQLRNSTPFGLFVPLRQKSFSEL